MDERSALNVIPVLDRTESGPFSLTVFDGDEVDYQTDNLRYAFTLIQEINNYLDGGRENYVGHGSNLHNGMKRFLESFK